MVKNALRGRRSAILAALLVTTAQIGCGSVAQTTDWHTVSSGQLEELSDDARRSPSSRDDAVTVYVECERTSPARRSSNHHFENCATLDVAGGDDIRVFPAYRRPVALPAFEFTVDDGQLRMEEDGSSPLVVDRDEIVAVQVGEQRRSRTRTAVFAGPTVLAAYGAFALTVFLILPFGI